MSNVITYEASVYTRTISYKNLKGAENTIELEFALSPIELLRVIAGVPTPKKSKSRNPAQKAQDESGLSEEQVLKFLVDIADRSAGFVSDDGESFIPFDNFKEHIAGQAFITKLASSDGDRAEFAQKVIIDPFEAFVNYAAADEGNTEKEIADFREMLESMRRIFATDSEGNSTETVEEKRARIQRELDELGEDV